VNFELVFSGQPLYKAASAIGAEHRAAPRGAKGKKMSEHKLRETRTLPNCTGLKGEGRRAERDRLKMLQVFLPTSRAMDAVEIAAGLGAQRAMDAGDRRREHAPKT
jgi:hypothetical protein